MKNSEFQKAYLKIIEEENKLKFDSFIIFEADENKNEAAQKDASKQVKELLVKDVPKPPQKSALGAFFGGLVKGIGAITETSRKIIQQVPLVGKPIAAIARSVDPSSKDFLNINKIPDAFVAGYDDIAKPVTDFFKNDEDGKKLAQQFGIKSEEDAKAVYARTLQAQKLAELEKKQAQLKKLQEEIQKKYKLDAKNKEQTSKANYRENCSDIYDAVDEGKLKPGEYLIHLED